MARILVIDDDSLFRGILECCLRDRGHEVLTAEDGRSGLAIIEQSGLDLVLSDVDMPRLSGLEVGRAVALLKLGQRPPVVLMTGRPSSDVLAKAKQAGVLCVLAKPFSLAMFERALPAWLDAARPGRSSHAAAG
ncbi:hypothetical protein MASR2M8_07200 [Opitutaceae bacterium]